MEKTEWIICPVCGQKTRNKIREDTVMINFPLFCPKCKQESLIEVKIWKSRLSKNNKKIEYCAPMVAVILQNYWR